MSYGENIFTGMIDENGTIWDMATGRKRQAVGVDSQKEQELLQTISAMQETLDNWRPKMIEHGYIAEPKTPEQIAQEAANEQLRLAQEQAAQQAKINEALLNAIQGLQSEIKELKPNGSNGHGVIVSGKQVGQNSEQNREIPATGKPSVGKGKTDTTAK